MRIEHIAIWCQDLEKMKKFYMKYFQMKASEKYENHNKKFSSYFLSFPNSEARLEIMHREDIPEVFTNLGESMGLTHFSISVGSAQMVDELTERFRADQIEIKAEPRTTGDRYYESVILDVEGNQVEIIE